MIQLQKMEASGNNLLNQILPPRIEDAGLEDCALPPDSIKEAFFKAASAVKSRASTLFHDDEEPSRCVEDPWPSDSTEGSDSSAVPVPEVPGPCGVVKGGGVVEEGRDEVVVVGGGEEKEGGDVVVVGGDGLEGLSIEEEEKENNEGKKKKKDEKPTLVEGVV